MPASPIFWSPNLLGDMLRGNLGHNGIMAAYLFGMLAAACGTMFIIKKLTRL